ncbi:hypothetical protein GCM10010195_45840 [Kitasatospora griseola]|nr:hypothetical protein GCM10010195_45840 [Kitasatospora griseola]
MGCAPDRARWPPQRGRAGDVAGKGGAGKASRPLPIATLVQTTNLVKFLISNRGRPRGRARSGDGSARTNGSGPTQRPLRLDPLTERRPGPAGTKTRPASAYEKLIEARHPAARRRAGPSAVREAADRPTTGTDRAGGVDAPAAPLHGSRRVSRVPGKRPTPVPRTGTLKRC